MAEPSIAEYALYLWQVYPKMKNNASLVYNFGLIIGDFLALLVAFVVAYILRVTLSHRVLSEQISAFSYFENFLAIIPFFILIFALLGLYTNRSHERRFQEVGNLFIGTFVGILFIISYSYVTNTVIFPARLVTLYGFGLAFFFVLLFRTFARAIRRELFNYGFGINNVIIIGDTRLAHSLILSLANVGITGYRVKGLVGSRKPGRPDSHYAHYATFAEAVAELGKQTHTIIQTELYADGEKNDEILTYAQEHHIAYRFVPGNNELFTGNIDVEIFHSVPVIAVHQTALVGWGRVVKRLFDLVAASLALIVASPFMLVIAILVKMSDGGPVFFRHERLSRFDSKVKILKFRSNKIAYSGLEPEAAFTKMGRPELIKEYRDNGDQLENDPRVTGIGHFIRKYSLDELPQLINIIRGDISLVGPRALVAYELDKYSQKNLILSVKSGLTGLAQVSGRKDINFEERRALDLYYVQNWTFWGDIVIIIKTVWIVLRHAGAR
jgi:exopolysaccharide biosynthesis polyprenyl glycosylphosphotransferase